MEQGRRLAKAGPAFHVYSELLWSFEIILIVAYINLNTHSQYLNTRCSIWYLNSI